MTLSELIVQYRDAHGLSQRQFAAQCSLSNGYISMIERGENPTTRQPIMPTLPKLKQLANGMGMTLSDLLTSVDDMPVDIFPDSVAYPANVLPMPDTYTVPLLGEIACGKPILAVEDATETVDVPSWVHADFALKCKGDSMINARIFDGDIVYIRKQSQVDNGQIAAVRIGEEATLKKVYYTSSRITLRAANPLYEDLVYEESQLDEVEILGKAVAFTSMIR